MDRTERFYKIEQLLHNRKVVPLKTFLDELGVSHATFKRDLEYLRDRIEAPIEYDRDAGGYRFTESTDPTQRHHELPGLWFNDSEVHALLSMQELLRNIEPGILAPQIEPLKNRLQALLEQDDFSAKEISSRIRLVHSTKRPVLTQFFEVLATTTLKRRRVVITHYNRNKDESTVREVSPQQLIFYRYNWYLDAWCHLRNDLRTFSVDAITAIKFTDTTARNIPKAELNEHFEKSYGIFSGGKIQTAKLRFAPKVSRWVSHEVWHQDQKSSFDKQEHYLLEIPFSDDRELLMEILKYGDDVEVLAPASLKKKIKETLKAALAKY